MTIGATTEFLEVGFKEFALKGWPFFREKFLVWLVSKCLTMDTFGRLWQPLAMPRKLRIEYPGAMYHVMNGGGQRDDIKRFNPGKQEYGG
jgi:hypothetical protein